MQFDPRLPEVLAYAIDSDASPETVQVLENAVERGEAVGYEDVRQAVYRTIECLEELGLHVITADDPSAPGGIAFAYGIPGRTGDLPSAVDEGALWCQERDVVALDTAFQMTHPAPPEELEDQFAPYRDDYIRCLEERGAEPDADASAVALLELGAQREWTEGFALPCVDEVGLTEVW